ncbi:MAG: hypothetical protein KBD78_02200 [Oligoflexales bacterium]|nr:hypothetical protein [Oligoflexales bacterium]
MRVIIIYILITIYITSCQTNKEESGKNKEESLGNIPSYTQPRPRDAGEEPEVPIDPNGEFIPFELNYSACSAAGGSFVQSYDSQPFCASEHAIIVINDGSRPQMMCCAMPTGFFASSPVQRREKSCGQNEVAVGMEPFSFVHCRAINSSQFKLGNAATSQYVHTANASDQGSRMFVSLQQWGTDDLCSCPTDTVFTGNHSEQDNVCQDACAKILKAK